MVEIPRGEEYADRMVEESTTKRGEEMERNFNEGMSPAAYLEARGWHKRSIPNGSLQEGWETLNFLDPVYENWADLDEALNVQYGREVESLGGYERLLQLVDEFGVPAWELQY